VGGRYFEEFEVGQRFVHEVRRTVTDMDNILFSALTHNPAAIHIDHEYAKSTEFGKPLVNSIFTLGLVVGLSVQDTTLGTTVGNSAGRTCDFRGRSLPATRSGRKRGSSTSAPASRDRRKGS
jgi:acyl dehydratase